MIWPRGFVAAAAYWNFDNATDPSSPQFVQGIYKLNDALRARNLSTCPSNCSCDQTSACGVPYLPPPPPPPPPQIGTPVGMTDCSHASRWTIVEQPGGTFKVATAPLTPDAATDEVTATASTTADAPLCWSYPAANSTTKCTGCLVLGLCAAAPTFNRTQDGAIVNAKSHLCVDLNGQGALGAWECGDWGQPNQRFAVDSQTGMIMSGAAGYGAEGAYAGKCAAAPVPPDA
jgi:hypothetical protein